MRINNLMGDVNEKGAIEKTSTHKQKVTISMSKKSKYELQPYIGSYSCRWSSQNRSLWAFSLP